MVEQFSGRGRGGVIVDHDDWMQECLRQSAAIFDIDPLRQLWARFTLLPPGGPDVMSHTDLTPGNILVADDRLTGVLDGGGFGPADPALDLVCAWHLLGKGPREVLRRELGAGDLEWERGKAWAFEQAMGAAWYYRTSNPAMSLMGTSHAETHRARQLMIASLRRPYTGAVGAGDYFSFPFDTECSSPYMFPGLSADHPRFAATPPARQVCHPRAPSGESTFRLCGACLPRPQH